MSGILEMKRLGTGVPGRTGKRLAKHSEPVAIERHREFQSLLYGDRAAKEAARQERLAARDQELEAYVAHRRAGTIQGVPPETELIVEAQRRLLRKRKS